MSFHFTIAAPATIVTPAQAGVQHRAGRGWTPACAEVTGNGEDEA